MKKLLLFLLFLSTAVLGECVTYYAVNAGGNWQTAATWSTVSAKDATRVGGAVLPTNADTCVLDDYSGAVTVDNTACVCKVLDCMVNGAYDQTLTFTAAKTLTVSGNVTFSSDASFATSGTGTLAVNATGSLTSNGKSFSGTLSFAGTSQTYTLVDNWTTLNLAIGGTTAVTVNRTDSTHGNITVTGNVTLSATSTKSGTSEITMTGTSGTATLSHSSTGALRNNLTIAAGANTVSMSGTIYYNTGTFKYTSGTVDEGTSSFACNGAATTLDTDGMEFYILYFGSYTYKLLGDISCNNIIYSRGVNPVMSGNYDITTSNFRCYNTNATTFKLVAGTTLTVTDGMIITCGTFSSDTASSAANLTYTGAQEDCCVAGVTFTDIDASGSSAVIRNWHGQTLTRTTNIQNIDDTDLTDTTNCNIVGVIE